MVIGDEKKYIVALITLQVKYDLMGRPTSELSNEIQTFLTSNLNSKAKTVQEAISDSNVLTFIQKCVDQVNVKAISRVAQIKKWRIIDKDFSIETGELTPTMKLKRKFISKKYANTIKALYHDPKL